MTPQAETEQSWHGSPPKSRPVSGATWAAEFGGGQWHPFNPFRTPSGAMSGRIRLSHTGWRHLPAARRDADRDLHDQLGPYEVDRPWPGTRKDGIAAISSAGPLLR
ncbi:hypothetical protein GCM10010254_75060 [Streptomyces chromofuscus]|nr:hypothetical protein GCM10010254_75060 [Streptomyces chromofuscus]